MNFTDKFKELEIKDKAEECSKEFNEEVNKNRSEEEIESDGRSDYLGEVVPTENWSLAHLVCYHHRCGADVEHIGELAKTDEETVRLIVDQAKAEGLYDKLANVLEKGRY